MERRYFLSTSAIGAIGAGHLLKAATSISLHHSSAQLEDFRQLMGARQCHFLAVDRSLDDAGTAAARSYTDLGYRPVGVSSFWLAGACTALLPLQLMHQSEGIIDTQVLVFYRSSIGAWHSSGALSGFHLEAIFEALPELQLYHSDSDDLRNLVLPKDGKGAPFINGWAHDTESGNFGISVQITSGQTLLEAAITQGGKTIWQAVFASRHALRCAPGLFA